MAKIYVSDGGDDQNDGRSIETPIRSWQRVLELKSGNDKLYIVTKIGVPKLQARLRLKERPPRRPVKLRFKRKIQKTENKKNEKN